VLCRQLGLIELLLALATKIISRLGPSNASKTRHKVSKGSANLLLEEMGPIPNSRKILETKAMTTKIRIGFTIHTRVISREGYRRWRPNVEEKRAINHRVEPLAKTKWTRL